MSKLQRVGHYLLSLTLFVATLVPSAIAQANPTAPDNPRELRQLTNDGKTVLQAGDTIVQHELILRATLSDPDTSDTVTLEVELRSISESFKGTPTHLAIGQPTIANAPITVDLPVSLPTDGSYHWQARARDALGALSEWRSFPFPSSNPEGAADFIVDTTGPKPPTNVKAQADFARATVTWTNSTESDFDHVEVYRSNTAGELGALVGTSTGTSFTSTGLDEGRSYYFSLISVDKIGRKGNASDQALAVTELRPDDGQSSGYSESGTWNTVSSAAGQFSDYRWAAGTSGATATYRPNVSVAGDYEIYVSWVVDPTGVPGPQATNAPYKVVTPARDESFSIDQSLKANGNYEENAWSGWKLLGTFTLGSGSSSTITLTATANGFVVTDSSRFVYLRPAAPKNLTVTDRPDDRGNVLMLSWTGSVSPTTLKYRLYRTQRSGSYDFTAKLAELTSTSYTDDTVVPGATYFYIVTAFDGTNESAPSLEVSGAGIAQTVPASPANLAISITDTQATLSWSKIDQAAKYLVRYRKVGETSFLTQTIDGAAVTTTTVTGLTPQNEYDFSVAAQDSSGNSSSFTSAQSKTLSSKVAAEVAKGKTVEEAEKAVKTEEAKEKVAPKEEEQIKAEPEKAEEAAPAKRGLPRSVAVAIVIVLVAIGAGLVGYYGLEWLSKEKQPPTGPKPPSKRNGRW